METLGNMKSRLIRGTEEAFFTAFGRKDKVTVIRSPGRVNLIGEHTDYNDGFVLPAAIDRSMNFAVSKRNDSRCRLHAADIDDDYEFDIEKPGRSRSAWANYLVGVVDQMNRAGCSLRGFDCLFGGDIPIGAGLSSSAAIEAGLAFALNEVFELGFDRVQLAVMAQKCEHEFVGVMCGIMDQFTNLLAKEDSFIKLDCRTLDYEYLPFDMKNLCLVLCNTGVKHDLANSEYNLRRQQCEEGVCKIAGHGYAVSKLRDVTRDMLDEFRTELGPVVYKRCRYVLEENGRVGAACESLREKDYVRLGELLYASHDGLRRMYDVSCEELDLLVDTATAVDGVLGARMMGGGFGGCTINLVEAGASREFKARARKEYEKKFGRVPDFYECKIVPGTEVVSN